MSRRLGVVRNDSTVAAGCELTATAYDGLSNPVSAAARRECVRCCGGATAILVLPLHTDRAAGSGEPPRRHRDGYTAILDRKDDS